MDKKCVFISNIVIALIMILNNYSCVISTSQDGLSMGTDQQALEEIKAQVTANHSGALSKSWTADTPFCNWAGVSCGFRLEAQRVIALDLSNMGVVGKISPQLGNLSFLTLLDLTNNSFHGSIPPEIMQLRHLEEVYMGHNNLTGNLPLSYFENLPKLEILFLDNNDLTGTLSPFFLDSMPSLKTLVLRHNSLHGNIPDDIGNRSRLQDFYVDYNQLTGLVPHTLFNLSSLRRLALSFNSLSGSLPSDMCIQLSNLRQLFVSGNQFTGPIPSSIHRCQQLRYLSMFKNKFDGSIPRGIGNLTLLEKLYLGENDFHPGMNDAFATTYLASCWNYLFNMLAKSVSTINAISTIKLFSFQAWLSLSGSCHEYAHVQKFRDHKWAYSK
uniref:LRR receptor-like serine/threonine-protein kinase EFR n=1 Tax=Erigeron canadensis TaxID=72917 RepID=UPI001CB928EA|nr:LRR receptor-like serine/threonine-protein kinase EFR [Erigeron canadensis]